MGWGGGGVGGSVRRTRSCHVDPVGWGEVGYKRHVHGASPCASSSNLEHALDVVTSNALLVLRSALLQGTSNTLLMLRSALLQVTSKHALDVTLCTSSSNF